MTLQNNTMDAFQHCAHYFASAVADTLHTVAMILVVVANIDLHAAQDKIWYGHVAGDEMHMNCYYFAV